MKPKVTVEFYGMPRHKAGCSELAVSAATLAEALAQIELSCPGLKGLFRADGSLEPQYLISIDGREFTRDLDYPLSAGTRLLLLSADAGG
jgi:molybdopterin converting factor small subunit